MKTTKYIDEEDPDRIEQTLIVIKKLGEGNQANVYEVEIDQQRYALKLVSIPQSLPILQLILPQIAYCDILQCIGDLYFTHRIKI